MPVISSEYKAANYFLAGDLQTILPALFRRVGNVVYTRERITTPDQDFLDLDWSLRDSDRLAIISHGLEGNTYTPYCLGMVKALSQDGWDVCAWNYRGCSGEINLQQRFYHSGETSDLHFVIDHAVKRKKYKKLVLIGFSIGGNITLKYLGEYAAELSTLLHRSIVFSVPCDLASGAKHLARFRSKIYMNRFLKSLRLKITAKEKLYPGSLSLKGLDEIRNFYEFDEKYTAPIHGFESAEIYWKKNSSKFFIDQIKTPVLIVNAKNDPFLTPECFPVAEAGRSSFVYLEIPEGGGHCGFYQKNSRGMYWSEQRALEFLQEE